MFSINTPQHQTDVALSPGMSSKYPVKRQGVPQSRSGRGKEKNLSLPVFEQRQSSPWPVSLLTLATSFCSYEYHNNLMLLCDNWPPKLPSTEEEVPGRSYVVHIFVHWRWNYFLGVYPIHQTIQTLGLNSFHPNRRSLHCRTSSEESDCNGQRSQKTPIRHALYGSQAQAQRSRDGKLQDLRVTANADSRL